MAHDAIAKELIGLLRDSREQAKFLGELGVENIALDSSSDQSADAPAPITGAAAAPARVAPSANPQPALEVPRRKTSTASPLPADSLFGEVKRNT